MDAILTGKAEQLAREIASQTTSLEELNGLLKLMMGSASSACSTPKWMFTSAANNCLGPQATHWYQASRIRLLNRRVKPVRRIVAMVIPKRPCRAISARS